MQVSLDKEISALKYHRAVFSELLLQGDISEVHYVRIIAYLDQSIKAIQSLFNDTKRNEYLIRSK